MVHLEKLNRQISELEASLVQSPDVYARWIELGRLQLEAQNPKSSLRAYSQAAIVAIKQGDSLQAIAALKSAHRVDPQHIKTVRELARLVRRQDNVKEARYWYDLMRRIALESHHKDHQIEALEGLIALDDTSIGTRLELAELMLTTPRVAEAAPHFHYVFEACRRQANIEDLIRVGERLIYVDRSQVEVMKTLARVYLGKKQPLKAQKKMELALKEAPDDLEALELLATSFQELGELYRARQLFRETVNRAEIQGHRDVVIRVLEKIRMLGGTSVVISAPTSQELDARLDSDPYRQQRLEQSRRNRNQHQPATSHGRNKASFSQQSIDERIHALSGEGPPVGEERTWSARELEARAFIKIGLYDDAERELKSILADHGDILSVWLWLGHVYEWQGAYASVRTVLNKLIELGEQEDDPRLQTWRNQLIELEETDSLPNSELGARPSLVFERNQVGEHQDQIQIPKNVLMNLERYRQDIPQDRRSRRKPPPLVEHQASLLETVVLADKTDSDESESVSDGAIQTIRHRNIPAMVSDIASIISHQPIVSDAASDAELDAELDVAQYNMRKETLDAVESLNPAAIPTAISEGEAQAKGRRTDAEAPTFGLPAWREPEGQHAPRPSAVDTASDMLIQQTQDRPGQRVTTRGQSADWFMPDPSMPLDALGTDLSLVGFESMTSPGQTHLELARAYIEMGMYEDARLELEELVEDERFQVDADMMLTEIHLELDAPKAAMQTLIRLQKSDLGRNDSIQMLKLLYRTQGRLGQLHAMQKTRRRLRSMGVEV